MFGPCFKMQYLVSFCSHLTEEERASSFTLCVFLVPFCVSSSRCRVLIVSFPGYTHLLSGHDYGFQS